MDPHSSLQLREADFVLGILGLEFSPVCREELNLAKNSAKKILVLASPGLASYVQETFPGKVYILNSNSSHPQNIITFLRQQIKDDAMKTALIGLGIIAAGLMIFSQ